jgi:hypothetical protein
VENDRCVRFGARLVFRNQKAGHTNRAKYEDRHPWREHGNLDGTTMLAARIEIPALRRIQHGRKSPDGHDLTFEERELVNGSS